MRQPERRLRVDEVGPRAEHLFERLAGLERASRLEQHPRHAVAQVLEPRAEGSSARSYCSIARLSAPASA